MDGVSVIFPQNIRDIRHDTPRRDCVYTGQISSKLKLRNFFNFKML